MPHNPKMRLVNLGLRPRAIAESLIADGRGELLEVAVDGELGG